MTTGYFVGIGTVRQTDRQSEI